jgi:hypothetical protein
VEDALVPVPDALRRLEAWRDDTVARLDEVVATITDHQDGARALLAEQQRRLNVVLALSGVALVVALTSVVVSLLL